MAGTKRREPSDSLDDLILLGQIDMTSEPRETSISKSLEVATLAGGCFWCTEAIFDQLKGVVNVESGYTGGNVANPSYQDVCTGDTGHAESIQISFDPSVLSYADLLRIFFTTHDPTTVNRQGADVGTQYRSAVFYHNPEQERVAKQVIQEFEKSKVWERPIVTEIVPYMEFYKAEDYHQEYYVKNSRQPYCRVVIEPKIAKLREHYRERLKK
ncbi:MAG TPA: peptide-methionine (S)-S-oxide reductase MsrA [Candidatus Dormibacteraeota bacterium]|nr:peptide-methionine (S)-S-oxide reductase MsrA [Candidatus Dormibacteraeota bacterium]